MSVGVDRVSDRGGTGPLADGVTQADAAAMLAAALEAFQRWGIDYVQARKLLGEPSLATYQEWKRGEIRSIPVDTLRRLHAILGIHSALGGMFTVPERGYQWLSRPNDVFGGRSALDRMLAGAPADLQAVRTYLEAERAGW